jgi:YVTN family beta-propeller protein
VFDLETLKIIGQAKTGEKPDGSLYDPSSKSVFSFNKSGGTATVIDASTYKVLGQIELGGEPESGVADGNGKVFINIESKNQIAVVDSHKLKLLATWSLAPGDEPTGLAFDPTHRRLFSVCHNQLMMILNADTGKVVKTLPIGKRVDAAGFDEVSQNAFSSNGDGTLTVVHESDPKSFAVLQNVETQAGARTMALDTKKQQVWLVSATPKDPQQEVQAPKKGQHIKKVYEPNSFTAIVVGK